MVSAVNRCRFHTMGCVPCFTSNPPFILIGKMLVFEYKYTPTEKAHPFFILALKWSFQALESLPIDQPPFTCVSAILQTCSFKNGHHFFIGEFRKEAIKCMTSVSTYWFQPGGYSMSQMRCILPKDQLKRNN